MPIKEDAMTMVVGMYDSLVEVQRAVADLIDAGYARNTISSMPGTRATRSASWSAMPGATAQACSIVSSQPRAMKIIRLAADRKARRPQSMS
jgi:predicted ATP-dependent protease